VSEVTGIQVTRWKTASRFASRAEYETAMFELPQFLISQLEEQLPDWDSLEISLSGKHADDPG
jgi:hypothetical protein